MDTKQAANLKETDRVRHVVDDVQGEVIFVQRNYVVIRWDDGMESHDDVSDLCEVEKIY